METRRQFEDDDDLEIPEIDSLPKSGRKVSSESLETTGADGIPFFLKGEAPRQKEKVKDSSLETTGADGIPFFLKGEADSRNEVPVPEVQNTYDEPEETEEKNSSFVRIVTAGICFVALTAVLFFAGTQLVRMFGGKAQEAPIETVVPAETSVPSVSPTQSADQAQ